MIAPGTGEPLIQDFKDISIAVIRGNDDSLKEITGFQVLDEFGNKYIFGPVADFASTVDFRYYLAMEVLPDNLDLRPKTTWHLVKIVTSNNEEVTFDYRVETVTYWRKSFDTGPPDGPYQQQARSYFSKVTSNQYQISQINYPGGKVVFTESDKLRLDVKSGARALDKVEIYDQNNNLVKGYKFSYEFVESTDLDNQLTYLKSSDPSAKYRMFLKSIKKSKAGDSLPPYQFEYSSVKLPGRFSTSQDVWGFYNGADNGEFLTFYLENDDRKVDTTRSGAGLLKKVTYPTGGSATFFYEQNKAVKPPFWDDLRMLASNPTVEKSVHLGIFDTLSNGVYSTGFTIGEDLLGVVYSSIRISSYSDEDPCDGNTASDQGCPYLVKVTKVNSNGDVIDGPWSLNTGEEVTAISDPGSYVLTVKPDYNVEPPIFDPSNPGNPFYTFSVHLHWEETVNDSINDPFIYASGKRIKKIEYRNELGVVRTKRYEYKTPSGDLSGRIFGFPAFYAPIRSLFAELHQLYHKYGSKPGSPLISLQGNKVGYSHVTEYFGKKNPGSQIASGGKIEYVFTNFEDTGEYYEFPYTLPTDNEWLRGKLLFKKIYENKNDNYILRKSIQNRYRYADFRVVDNPEPLITMFANANGTPINIFDNARFVLPLAQIADMDGNPSGGTGTIVPGLKIYYQTGGTADLHSTTTTYYFNKNGTTREVKETTNYFYDYANHYQTVGTEFIDSEDNKTINKIYYPVEVNSPSALGHDLLKPEEYAAIKAMRDQHQWAVPVQVETEVKNSAGLVVANSAQRTLFKDEGGIIVPETYQVSKGNGSLEGRLEFHAYDNRGNPLETSTPQGPHTVYLWGYNDQYLIAKIENATLSEVATALEVSASQLEAVDETDLDTINALRGNMSLINAQVTTYTYKPLIGMASKTDPRGYTIHYEYDFFNRLKSIKDDNGNILKSFEYKYRP